jgi:zinc transporter ZupT
MLKIIFAATILLVILSAGFLPFKKRLKYKHHHDDFAVGETIATGVFLGAGLLHMLPEANAMFAERHYTYPIGYLITGIVFLLFLWLEHLGKELYAHKKRKHPAFAILACFMLSVHSFLLATALGMSREYTLEIMLFLAIITHKWAESFAIASQLSNSSLNIKISIILFLSFALMSPLGVYIGWYCGHSLVVSSQAMPVLMAISAGTFFYLGTLHGLERCVMVERCCNLRDFTLCIIGFLMMALVAFYV